MATLPLNPANPSGAQVVDSMALLPPLTSGQTNVAVTPKTTGVVAPAVVTSETARKQTLTNKQQLDALAKQAAAIKVTLDLKAKEEALAKAEADKVKKDTALDSAITTMSGSTPTAPVKSQEQIQAEADARNVMNQMDQLQAKMDARAGALIQSIRDEYAGLIRQQEEVNKSYEAGTRTEGFRSERARYAPLLQGQIIKSAIDSGLQKIADLNVKKNRLILEAENARDEKSFKALQSSMTAYREIVKEERELAQKTYENAINASKAAREQLKFEMDQDKYTWDYASTIAPSVADEVSNIKDPAQKASYIQNLATQIGIDPGVLFGEVQKYTDTNSAKASTGVKEYQFAVEQGFKGTLLQYKQSIAAATRTPNTLTAYEAAAQGLPKTMIGMSEGAVQSQLNSPNIPGWFKEKMPGATQKDWNDFRMAVPSSGSGSLASAILNSYTSGNTAGANLEE